MSVEHANQLRQLIVEKHRPQPAGLANIYILRSLSTIASVPLDNPKSFPFICQLASTHTKKNFDFMRQPVPVTKQRTFTTPADKFPGAQFIVSPSAKYRAASKYTTKELILCRRKNMGSTRFAHPASPSWSEVKSIHDMVDDRYIGEVQIYS